MVLENYGRGGIAAQLAFETSKFASHAISPPRELGAYEALQLFLFRGSGATT
jgi:hypothetical protein